MITVTQAPLFIQRGLGMTNVYFLWHGKFFSCVPVCSDFYFGVFTADQLWDEGKMRNLCGSPAKLKDNYHRDEEGHAGPLRGEGFTARTLVEDEAKGQYHTQCAWGQKQENQWQIKPWTVGNSKISRLSMVSNNNIHIFFTCKCSLWLIITNPP